MRSKTIMETKDHPLYLTAAKFFRTYSQHVDIRNRKAGTSAEVANKIRQEGFRQSMGVNTLPPYRGGDPTNIVDHAYAPKKGDFVYLVPNTHVNKKYLNIKAGWQPKEYEIIQVESDFPSMYQLYLEAIFQHHPQVS